MKMIKDVNIIIPLKNEDEQIEITINLLSEELKNLKKDFVITLIDDHSYDETWNLLNKLKQKYSNIQIYKNEYQPGYGNAVRFGIEKNKSEGVIFFMGDCSDNPKDIINYVDYLDQGFDCVFGSRFTKNSIVEGYPLLKLINNSFLYALNALVTSLYFIKNNNLMKLFAILFNINFSKG